MKSTARGCLRGVAWASGLVVVALALFYWWQPWEIDLVQRRPAEPLPRVDPATVGLFDAGSRVLIVAAHPDDPEFYVGATLLQLGKAGARTKLLVATDGDKAYYPFSNPAETAATRRREQASAAASWGCHDVSFLGFPDGRLTASEPLVRSIERAIAEFRPTHILSFDPEYPPRASHADHRRAADATLAAIHRQRFTGWTLFFSTVAPTYIVDASNLWPEKRRLLMTHASQFGEAKMATRIDPMILGAMREAGARSGVDLGEGLRAWRLPSSSGTRASQR